MRYHAGSCATHTRGEIGHLSVFRSGSGRGYIPPIKPSSGRYKQLGVLRPGQVAFGELAERRAVDSVGRDIAGLGEETNPSNTTPSFSGSPQILLAEDDILWREYSAFVLRSAGFEVDSVADGDRAWKMFGQKRYDLIITDNDMPEMTGVELFARIRIVNDDVPILVISGSSAAAQIFVKAGFQNWKYLPKPFSADHLIDTVRRVVSPGCSATFDI